jgi:hypothetical protein
MLTPAGDLQSVGVVAHADESVTARHGRGGHLGHRLDAVAPFRVHLEIAAIVLQADRPFRRRLQDAQRFGSAQEVGAKRARRLELAPPRTLLDRALDAEALALLEVLEDHPLAGRPT